MSLYPYYHHPPFYYPNDVPNPIILLECLASAHQMGGDHAFLMSHLKQIILTCREIIQQHSASIIRYLRTNLERSLRIVETIECLPLVHDYMLPLTKRQITAFLCQQYPSEVCFHEQIIILAEININLVELFIRLVRSLTKWFRKEVQERNFGNIETYELQYSINSFYAEERYKFDNHLQIENQEIFDNILYLYRFVVNSPRKLDDFLWNRLMDGLFYFLCNKSILLDEASRYVYYSIREMMAMRGNLTNVQRDMARLIMPKIRKAGQANNQEEIESVLGVFRDGIVNLLASVWTVELECFWLWKFKLACDLLQVLDKMQLDLIKEIRVIYKQIMRFLSS